ncbi:hypothetical protein DNTS_030164 [Danionella cerebrum]|uniref:Pellino E3 ubiquitin protein ligase family member 3 n=1 Tax=Danionella cerebrum TaxID=2873325 RepID=A0A553Q810_9TELE|nr:hypothetical protein DNTS_030164 [Danionella translucida]
MLCEEQEQLSSSKPVKYGELIVLGFNGSLPNGDRGRRKSHFSLYKRAKANGVKPGSCTGPNPKVVRNQHSVSYALSRTQTVVVEYTHDANTDMFQIGRSTESPIDFMVLDSSPVVVGECDPASSQSTVSRFACRIVCARRPPYKAHLYAAGFDSSRSIFLGEKAPKWCSSEGQMDGLTTNGVLMMSPRHGFTRRTAPGPWREISVCGNVFTLRETRSSQNPGKLRSINQRVFEGERVVVMLSVLSPRRQIPVCCPRQAAFYFPDQHGAEQDRTFSPLSAARTVTVFWADEARESEELLESESHELTDGSLIDLCGATLLWRSGDSPCEPRTPPTQSFSSLQHQACSTSSSCIYLPCGHVIRGRRRLTKLGYSEEEEEDDDHSDPCPDPEGEHRCPVCRARGRLVPLTLGRESTVFLDSAPPSHAFIPCGHVCSERTAVFWSSVLLPRGAQGFYSACPFCLRPLGRERKSVRLLFHSLD